ncbi:13304_t:CDS:2, partial [Gigaspora margarita]
NNNQRYSAFIQFEKREEMIKAIGQRVVFQGYNLIWHRLDEQFKKNSEMQEVKESASSKKSFNRLTEYYRKSQGTNYKRNNKAYKENYKKSTQKPRGSERRNSEEGAGYREQKYKKESEEKNFVNAYREVNPEMFESTWERHGSESRIDYVWYKKNANVDAYRCDVVDMENTTKSDHRMSLEKKLEKEWEGNSANESIGQQEELDRKWKVIEEGIIQAAEETLPKKKCAKDCELVGSCEKIKGLKRKARIISKLCRKCKWKSSQGISSENNKKIQIVFEHFGNEERLGVLDIWNADLYKQLTSFWQIVHAQ